MDKLEVMLHMQKTLQEKAYGYNFKRLEPEDRTAFIKEMSIHVNQEVNELLYELPFFKPWKDYSGMSDIEFVEAYTKARKEFIDVIHFIMNIAIGLEMTAEEIYESYVLKNEENYLRQSEGYTHDKRYRT